MVTNLDIKALNEFLENKGIMYVLTGTAALYYHGALPSGEKANDIDIIAITDDNNREALMSVFAEQERLSGCERDDAHYKQHVYIFKVGENNTKVNVFEGSLENTHSRAMLIDGEPINVHNVDEILAAKFQLKRQKDYAFFTKIINQLSSMFSHV